MRAAWASGIAMGLLLAAGCGGDSQRSDVATIDDPLAFVQDGATHTVDEERWVVDASAALHVEGDDECATWELQIRAGIDREADTWWIDAVGHGTDRDVLVVGDRAFVSADVLWDDTAPGAWVPVGGEDDLAGTVEDLLGIDVESLVDGDSVLFHPESWFELVSEWTYGPQVVAPLEVDGVPTTGVQTSIAPEGIVLDDEGDGFLTHRREDAELPPDAPPWAVDHVEALRSATSPSALVEIDDAGEELLEGATLDDEAIARIRRTFATRLILRAAELSFEQNGAPTLTTWIDGDQLVRRIDVQYAYPGLLRREDVAGDEAELEELMAASDHEVVDAAGDAFIVDLLTAEVSLTLSAYGDEIGVVAPDAAEVLDADEVAALGPPAERNGC